MKLGLMRFVLFFLCVACLSASTFAKEQEPRSLRIYPELESGWFLTGQLDFGCEVTYANGGKRRSTGYLNGNLPWGEFLVESDQASAHGDLLLVDLYKVRSNQQTLVIKVKLKNAPHVQSVFDLKMPQLEAISIFLPNVSRARHGKRISPHITFQWANRFTNSVSCCNRRSLLALDSIQIFLNNSRVFDYRITLPDSSEVDSQTFSLSVLWASKPWISDTQVYSFAMPHRSARDIFVLRRKTPVGLED